MTLAAVDALERSDVIVGYKRYVDQITSFLPDKQIIQSGMRQERERCLNAIECALDGRCVSLVSSGDSGVYGMAGLVYELLAEQFAHVDLEIEVIPGVTAATAAAALLGAPLMNDWAVLSLSDLLTPWDQIEHRLRALAQAGLVLVLYNPTSRTRQANLEKALQILLSYRSPSTHVGIVRNAFREDQTIVCTTLASLREHTVDMLSTIIVGNASTIITERGMVTRRGYRV